METEPSPIIYFQAYFHLPDILNYGIGEKELQLRQILKDKKIICLSFPSL